MQTGTAAFGNLYAKSFLRRFRSVRKQTPKLSDSIVGDINHCAEKYRCEVFKSKGQAWHAALTSRLRDSARCKRGGNALQSPLSSADLRIYDFGFVDFLRNRESEIYNLQHNGPDSLAL
jgi:hypothetical protein